MAEKLFRRFGHHYILVMMILTRVCGTVGGMLVIYYVELTLKIPDIIRLHFRIAAVVVVAIGCTLTVLAALLETRTLRRVLRLFGEGKQVEAEVASRAGHEAMVFLARHHRHEAWLVPCSTLLPVSIFLRYVDDASASILGNIAIAVFMGIAMALMSTFFVVEHFIQPVIRHLLDRGVRIDYSALPVGRLRFRFRLCFALIIMTTSLMIGTLARERASDILQERDKQAATRAVAELRAHSGYITAAALVTGLVFSTLLANSVAYRARDLVGAMARVGEGRLSERDRPTGNDEIDILARQFNVMVETLERHDHTIRDLNANLEHKVSERTRQLELTLEDLRETQSQLTDVAHRAGMAEIATGVLHNVGNVLNSVNVSATLLEERAKRSQVEEVIRFAARLEAHRESMSEFVNGDRGRKLVEYVERLAGKLAEERKETLRELESLSEKVGHIRGIISAQQNFARRVYFREDVNLQRLIEDVLDMHRVSLQRQRIRLEASFDELPPAHIEKIKLVQVLENLVKNAIESMAEQGPGGVLTVRAEQLGTEHARIIIADTGRGIAPEHMASIFSYGFTTKPTGNGFGLHSSALAMQGLGGAIRVRSDGGGRGAVFEVDVPLSLQDDHASPHEKSCQIADALPGTPALGERTVST
jgi:signal transduction histidine kinase